MSPLSDGDFNPYDVLGVTPIEGLYKIKQTYGRKLNEAKRSGDVATAALLEKAYDKLMYSQLMNMKKVSKDIKYADKQPIIPYGPRYKIPYENDMLINLTITTVFSAWIAIQPPSSPTYNEEGEENGRGLRMGKRLNLRSLSLVFGSILVHLWYAYTGILNVIEYMGSSIPNTLYNNQELIVTASSALMLYVMESYYR
ncbi:BnaCnng27080D [Brassica napus]|uniref:BnaCnng27080D protein n=1 Tax=Brassica napus TaxID=3708 RepID=A0A078ITK3_BRANA|nr:BnaCnng27080D [Brassica napus]